MIVISVSSRVHQMELLLEQARKALKFYADLKYSDKMGFPPECQWLAENTIAKIDALTKAREDDEESW